MHIPLPTLKSQFAASFSFLGDIILPTHKIKIKTTLLVGLITLFISSNVFAQTTITFTTPGAGTWTAPIGVTSVTVEVWGAGGGGQGVKSPGQSATGGGGSGGGFVKSTITVVPGTIYNLFIGSGGDGSESTFNNGSSSWFINNSSILAIGGNGASLFAFATNGFGSAAPTAGNIGGTSITTYGGSGGTSTSTTSDSGGGGSSAGNSGGNNAVANVGGSAPANGYVGANGINTNGVQGNPGGIGAGGSGAKKGTGSASPNGGLGGSGQIKITYCPTYSAGPNQTLATCATTATLAAAAVSSPATGAWTVVSGSGSVTTPTSPTSGVTGIVPGTPLVLRWTVTNGSCGSSSSDVTITSPRPIITNPATASTCSGTSTNITLTSSVPSTYTWTIGTITGTITGASAGSGSVINQVLTNPSTSTAGSVQYLVTPTATTGSCAGPAFTITVTVNPAPAATTVSGGGTFCGSTTITASGGTDGIIYFQGTTSGGTSVATPSSSQTVAASGTYYFRARSAGGCWGIEGSVVVTISSSLNAVAGNPIPANTSSNVCYTGTTSTTSISWSAAAGATSYDVYFGAGTLPGSITSNVATTNYTTGTLLSNTTYYWKVVPRNGCGITTGTPLIWSFKTAAVACPSIYCKPTTDTPENTYITDVRFLGTLNDVQNNNSGFSGGYQDFTGLPNKTIQAAGEGINVFVQSNGVDSIFKAWVDWNKNGLFNNTGPVTSTSELVYTSSGTRAISTTFGIVIPAGTAPGDYTIRIRNFRFADAGQPTGYNGNDTYDSCQNFTGIQYGEAEDYTITVVANCAANLQTVSNAIFCGPGALTLSGKGTAGTTNLRWYDAVTGGNLLAQTAVDGSLNASYTTPAISATTTYYVTAFNGTCESIFRRPVVARIRPIPNISFDLPPGNANFCGDDNTLKLTSAAEQEEIILIEENFDSGLGVFGVSTGPGDNSTVGQTQWQNQGSIFTPLGSIWKPAVSSGFGGNKFAFATSDYNTRTIHTILTSTGSYDTTGFTTLKLNFSAFYSFYGDTSTLAGGTVESLFVEVSTNGGTIWTPVKTYDYSLGIGTLFSQQSIDLAAYRNIPNLQIRFRYIAYWGDGVALDNIKLYGDKPLNTSFVWTAPNIGIYQSNCTTPYVNGTPTSSVCLKPTDIQLQTIASWNISALATLSNGCTSTGVIAVQNNNKVWDTASTDWAVTNWQPVGDVPDITKCVLIKQPVNIRSGLKGLAKVVKIESPSGKLTINGNGSLTIQNGLVNNAGVDNVVIESDGNLKQVTDNPIPANSGSVTARRNIKFRSVSTRDEYNYLISPVVGQSLKTLYPGVPTTATYPYILYHNETNNFFYNSSGAYIAGRGLAVKEPSVAHVAADNKDAEFKGPLGNGVVTFPLAYTNNTHGYNLVGNPYASNIDLQALYTLNGSSKISSTFYFWDNGANNVYVQEGNNYAGRAYAVYNAVLNTGNAAGFILPTSQVIGSKVPNNIAKVAQGFMVKTPSAGQTLTFNNSVRVVDNTGVKFFSKDAAPEVNRYWLRLISPTNAVNTIALVYLNEGSTSFGMDDSELNVSSSDMFYSLAEDHQLQIEGRPDFVQTDKIILGSQHFATGNYTIALAENEGIFANGQIIYLKDKQTGIMTNLSAGSYTFAANAGPSTGRFEIVYLPETVLATDSNVRETLVVYKDGTDFVVRNAGQNITAVEVFDASGRLMLKRSGSQKEWRFSAQQFIEGVFVVKATLRSGEVLSRKIRK
ncbi:hypothetical protein IV494_08515 [Kaistella sp. G5-32]|uniref:Secreted protein (Por secretion system target) n=1 Tax=Kaistella gelatinilytica TaxID=2787636 RepID=A0ABS0FBX6_9FLAO|nr:GEVED domain-containing protein [Kaistella gelatinilytica]MBF8457225.1 hypothetical protein [Kaistella gelatinilytica]